MSTRWYPRFIKGNPQLRVFLPNFWMKLVKTKYEIPPNTVQFVVSMEMTQHDIKNYLDKIYNVPVVNVRTRIVPGEIKKNKDKGYVIKDDDFKIAFITLEKGKTFTFPDIFSVSKKTDEQKDMEDFEKNKHDYNLKKWKNSFRPDVPSWFG